jgi:hypothetical protein
LPRRKPTLLERFEAKIGPTERWKGNCFGIATEAVKRRLVPKGSVAVYGHWMGAVHPQSMFAGKPIVQHGWVLQPDGQVCDPTRWVFEHVAPYIYVGEADTYDEGGNKHRMRAIGGAPPYNRDDTQYEMTKKVLPEASTWTFIEEMLGDSDAEPGIVCGRQLMWLANQDPRVLGDHAANVYAVLKRLKLSGFIPYDNQQMVSRQARKR